MVALTPAHPSTKPHTGQCEGGVRAWEQPPHPVSQGDSPLRLVWEVGSPPEAQYSPDPSPLPSCSWTPHQTEPVQLSLLVSPCPAPLEL